MLDDFNFESKRYLKIKRHKFLSIRNIYSTVESFKFLLMFQQSVGKFAPKFVRTDMKSVQILNIQKFNVSFWQ